MNKRGSVLVMALAASPVVLILCAGLVGMVHRTNSGQAHVSDAKEAFHMAEAGLTEAFSGLTLARTGNVGTRELPARGCPADKLPSRSIRDAFRSALTHLATREENLAGAINKVLAEAHPALLEPLVATLGARRGRAVRNDLRNALGLRREADALLFSLLAKRVKALGQPNDPRLEALTLDGLCARDSRTQTQAATLAAALDLVNAIPHLVEMVSRNDPLEGRAARQALRDLTHATPLADNQQWQAWFEQDQQWWQQEGPGLEDALYSTRPEDAVVALRTLSRYRWRVDGQLLADALSSLCACTELNLGKDPAIWRQVLAIRRR